MKIFFHKSNWVNSSSSPWYNPNLRATYLLGPFTKGLSVPRPKLPCLGRGTDNRNSALTSSHTMQKNGSNPFTITHLPLLSLAWRCQTRLRYLNFLSISRDSFRWRSKFSDNINLSAYDWIKASNSNDQERAAKRWYSVDGLIFTSMRISRSNQDSRMERSTTPREWGTAILLNLATLSLNEVNKHVLTV